MGLFCPYRRRRAARPARLGLRDVEARAGRFLICSGSPYRPGCRSAGASPLQTALNSSTSIDLTRPILRRGDVDHRPRGGSTMPRAAPPQPGGRREHGGDDGGGGAGHITARRTRSDHQRTTGSTSAGFEASQALASISISRPGRRICPAAAVGPGLIRGAGSAAKVQFVAAEQDGPAPPGSSSTSVSADHRGRRRSTAQTVPVSSGARRAPGNGSTAEFQQARADSARGSKYAEPAQRRRPAPACPRRS